VVELELAILRDFGIASKARITHSSHHRASPPRRAPGMGNSVRHPEQGRDSMVSHQRLRTALGLTPQKVDLCQEGPFPAGRPCPQTALRGHYGRSPVIMDPVSNVQQSSPPTVEP
jgi:hypothetical protein